MDVNDRMLTCFPLAPRRLGEAQRHEVAIRENGAVLIEMRQGQDFAIAEEVASVNRRAAVEAIGLCIVVAPVEAEHWRATCGIGQAKRTAQGGHEYVRIRERSLFLIDKEQVQRRCVARLLRRLLHQPFRVHSARSAEPQPWSARRISQSPVPRSSAESHEQQDQRLVRRLAVSSRNFCRRRARPYRAVETACTAANWPS